MQIGGIHVVHLDLFPCRPKGIRIIPLHLLLKRFDILVRIIRQKTSLRAVCPIPTVQPPLIHQSVAIPTHTQLKHYIILCDDILAKYIWKK